MKKVVVLSAILGLMGASFAHLPEGELNFAVQFPDGVTPTIDGDLGDWDIVPTNPYTIRNDKLFDSAQFQEAERGEIDATDINITHRFGWNETDNKLYFATVVFDNVHNLDRADIGRFFHDDAWEVEVNPDHTPREEHNQDFANQFSYKFAVPPIENSFNFVRPLAGLTWLVPGSEWLDFAFSFTGEEFGESTYFYEMSLTPFESMPLDEATALDGAIVWDLEEGDTIHLSINVGDVDAGDDYRGFWGTSPAGCCQAENDFVLTEIDPALEANVGTPVKSDTWGRIKSQFK